MAMTVRQIKAWLDTCEDEELVGIAEDGMSLETENDELEVGTFDE